ncbi:MAG: TRAP transporter substrate-binding protein DctP [Chloroflexota bacterium]
MKLQFNNGQFGPNDVPSLTFRWFTDMVTERTNGLLTFSHIYSYALTKPGEEIAALQAGLVDVGNTCVVYHPTTLYINSGFPRAVPFAISDVRPAAEVMYKIYYEGETAKILSGEYAKQGLTFLFVTVDDSYVLESKTPITTLMDLKGKKVACLGSQAGWLAAAGAAPVGMPIGPRPTALQTGVVEVSATPFEISYPFKLYEFAPHMIQTGWGAVTGNPISWNTEKFNQLPADVQKILMDTGKEAFKKNVDFTEKWYETSLSLAKAAGQIVHPAFSAADQAAWSALLGEPVVDWVKAAESKGIQGADKVVARYIELTEATGHKFPKQWMVK